MHVLIQVCTYMYMYVHVYKMYRYMYSVPKFGSIAGALSRQIGRIS